MSSSTTSTTSLTDFEARQAAHLRQKRRKDLTVGLLMGLAVLGSLYVGEVRPDRFVEGFPAILDYLHGTLPTVRAASVVADIGNWYWGFAKWLGLLIDTVFIAFLGTLFGALVGGALCFTASRNLAPSNWLYFLSRRTLELARTVPDLVFALIFVFAFGLGPMAGVLAIAVHTLGALGKLFAEVNENVDLGPVEGVRAAGGNWFQAIRYAVLPQVLPNYASYALIRFEINVRAASVVGFVGAGGIGQELFFVIRQFIYEDISAIVLMIVVTVAIIDVVSEKLRHRLIGGERLL